jgi:hypothetical protein
MTHRSPLATLAGSVVAFGIFFGINLANSAPHQEVGEGYSAGSPSATEAMDQPSAGPSPTATEAATPSASPAETAIEDGPGDDTHQAGRHRPSAGTVFSALTAPPSDLEER